MEKESTLLTNFKVSTVCTRTRSWLLVAFFVVDQRIQASSTASFTVSNCVTLLVGHLCGTRYRRATYFMIGTSVAHACCAASMEAEATAEARAERRTTPHAIDEDTPLAANKSMQSTETTSSDRRRPKPGRKQKSKRQRVS